MEIFFLPTPLYQPSSPYNNDFHFIPPTFAPLAFIPYPPFFPLIPFLHPPNHSLLLGVHRFPMRIRIFTSLLPHNLFPSPPPWGPWASPWGWESPSLLRPSPYALPLWSPSTLLLFFLFLSALSHLGVHGPPLEDEDLGPRHRGLHVLPVLLAKSLVMSKWSLTSIVSVDALA